MAIAGAVVRWLRDNMGIVKSSAEIGTLHLHCSLVVLMATLPHFLCLHVLSETLAEEAGTSYGCYFVPAFSGLYAPYWEPSARG